MNKWLGYVLPLTCGVLAIGCSEQEGPDLPQDCEEAFFYDGTECVPVTACRADQEEITPPTATSDRVCQVLEGCAQGTFRNSEDECQPFTPCTSDEFEFKAPTATSDRTCVDRAICNDDEYIEDRTGEVDGIVCHQINECKPEECEVAPPTTMSDRECAPLSECVAVGM